MPLIDDWRSSRVCGVRCDFALVGGMGDLSSSMGDLSGRWLA